MEPYKKCFAPFDPVKNRTSSSDKKKKPNEKFMAPIWGEITLPKESIKKQKVTNRPKLITQ